MNSKIFTREKAVRVKIDQPSTNQILHKLHGKIGIVVSSTFCYQTQTIRVYFTEGDLISMVVPVDYLIKY